MIVWLNGPFGVGKTTTARAIVAADPRWRLFDPETVGYMLMSNLHDRAPADFPDLAAWRTLVPAVATGIAHLTGMDLVAVQSVLVEQFWSELRTGLDASGLGLFHVVLDCDEDWLRERLRSDVVDPGAREWRLDHVHAYQAAREWLVRTADSVIDTTDTLAEEVAVQILAAVPARKS